MIVGCLPLFWLNVKLVTIADVVAAVAGAVADDFVVAGAGGDGGDGVTDGLLLVLLEIIAIVCKK